MNVTAEQVAAGQRISSELTNASIRKSFGGMGGCKELNLDDFHYKDLVRAYLDNEIDSVAAIYLAMKELEETKMKEKPICSYCGSDAVSLDAFADWDMETQEWVLGMTFDDAICRDCGEHQRIEFVEVEE